MNKLLFCSLQTVNRIDLGYGGCSLHLSSKRSDSCSTRPALVVEIQSLLWVRLWNKWRVSGYLAQSFLFMIFFDLPPWPWKGDFESIKCVSLSCCKYLGWGSLLGWLVFLKLLGWFPCHCIFSDWTSQNYSIKISTRKQFFDGAVVKSLLLRDYTSVTSTGKHTVLQVKCLYFAVFFCL